MRSNRAPLYEALAAHAEQQPRPFHVPGHKGRAGYAVSDANERFGPLLGLDLTELEGTDDLHYPSGPLDEAQKLAAACFGVEETRFLVGGSTSGNLAIVLALCEPGDLLLVQRNVHRSVIHALQLAGARAVFLSPACDPISGLALVPPLSLLQVALQRYPQAKGVVLSNPNYYGMGVSLVPYIEAAHQAGVPVAVDEAHGPHFGFHSRFPDSALRAEADVVVQSAHKMLSAMTMGAMLHMQGTRLPREAIRQSLRMVQSSSPSFPILASLDLARQQLDVAGSYLFEPALQAVDTLLAGLPATVFRAQGAAPYRNASIVYDPLKVALFDGTRRMNGFELKNELERRGCWVEMADARYAVIAFGVGSRREDSEALLAALHELSTVRPETASTPATVSLEPEASLPDAEIPEPILFRRYFGNSEAVPLEDSIGQVSAEWIVPYPPGVPLLFPGETVSPAIIEELRRWAAQGAQIQGPSDATVRTLQVQMKAEK